MPTTQSPRDAGRSSTPATDAGTQSAQGAGTGDAGRSDGGRAGNAALQPQSGLRLPPAGQGLDYQLGGAYEPPASVKIVSRDRKAKPAPGLYNICYVNGYQAQPDEEDFWLADHPDLVLRDEAGQPVIDEDWNELMFDVGAADKRRQLAEIIGGFIDGCGKSGFDAVEIDNLDSYTRSGGRLREQDAIDFMALLSQRAHSQGLAIAQKNSSELVARRAALGTDFAVSEECNRYNECDVYRAGYGDEVLVIEYRRGDFDKGCSEFPGLSIVLRDLSLVTPGNAAYVYDGC